jgi:hypothetical protein
MPRGRAGWRRAWRPPGCRRRRTRAAPSPTWRSLSLQMTPMPATTMATNAPMRTTATPGVWWWVALSFAPSFSRTVWQQERRRKHYWLNSLLPRRLLRLVLFCCEGGRERRILSRRLLLRYPSPSHSLSLSFTLRVARVFLVRCSFLVACTMLCGFPRYTRCSGRRTVRSLSLSLSLSHFAVFLETHTHTHTNIIITIRWCC